MQYDQLTIFDPSLVMTLEAKPGTAWVQCFECREYLLRTRLAVSLRKKCPFCGGHVSVYLDGGPRPRKKARP
jgi:hypothetical protein